MLSHNFEYIESAMGRSYRLQMEQANHSRSNLLKNLLSQRCLPEKGWDELSIQLALHEIASLDSNNFIGNVGIGEREGRVYSKIVQKRHFYFTHGVGRSGDIMEFQPKAAGSSLISVLTHALALDALHICGLKAMCKCCILPLATGMSLTLCLLTLKANRPNAKYVIWSRIDQKSCFKCILTAGCTPIVVELIRLEDQLSTDLNAIENNIKSLGHENIVSVITTTSTFAPRTPDNVEEVAKLCRSYEVPHIINNAYGLQCFKCCHIVEKACRIGRVDYIVQSVDKNFMVPVGGAIVCSPQHTAIDQLSRTYPGRASASVLLDLFITLLEMGKAGLQSLRASRKELSIWFHNRLKILSHELGTQVLYTPGNKISFAINLLPFLQDKREAGRRLTFIGSQLFSHRCTGARVVLADIAEHTADSPVTKTISNYTFHCYGSHSNAYPYPYMTVACAIGATKEELNTFLHRLKNTLTNDVPKDPVSLNSDSIAEL